MTGGKENKSHVKYDERLVRVGEVLRKKRLRLGGRLASSREYFIADRNSKFFGDNDKEWISQRHLANIENGYKWIGVEKLLKLAIALEVDPIELFAEIVQAWRGESGKEEP